MNNLAVSVVMGVFNGASALEATLRSVLEQQACDFEFIVVDDGSTDGTAATLDGWAAREPRLKVIHTPHRGLTAALAEGCGLVRGEFIARQDCGDLSLPGRLQAQVHHLREHPAAVLSACATQVVGPGGEMLFVTRREGMALHDALGLLDPAQIQGPPHHGATMFRRASYERVGGYRPAFIVAQDLDLWLRLRELGECLGLEAVGYEARLAPGSISARRRADQLRSAALAIECARLRLAGKDDREFLAAQPPLPLAPSRSSDSLERARFFYFVAACLRRTDPGAARRYFLRSFREHPLMLKALVRAALP